MWIISISYISCLSCFLVRSLHPRGHLLEKGWILGSLVCYVFICAFQPPPPPVAWAAVCSKAVVLLLLTFLFIITPIAGVCNCSKFCCTLLYVHSSIAIILMGKRELVALLNLSSWCLVVDERLFFVVPGGCLQFVIVVFPDHTHYFCGLGQVWCLIVPFLIFASLLTLTCFTAPTSPLKF